jgi:hypothetical protein
MGWAQERLGVLLLNGGCVKQVLACCGSAFDHQAPNPSIERTSSSKLRLLPAAAHVKR